MTKTLFRSAVAAAYLLAAVSATPASAEDERNFTLHNNIGAPITHLYITNIEAKTWKDDVLGEDVLEDGDYTKITFRGYDDDVCEFDIKIIVGKSSTWTVSDVDLCKTSDIKFSRRGDKVVYDAE